MSQYISTFIEITRFASSSWRAGPSDGREPSPRGEGDGEGGHLSPVASPEMNVTGQEGRVGVQGRTYRGRGGLGREEEIFPAGRARPLQATPRVTLAASGWPRWRGSLSLWPSSGPIYPVYTLYTPIATVLLGTAAPFFTGVRAAFGARACVQGEAARQSLATPRTYRAFLRGKGPHDTAKLDSTRSHSRSLAPRAPTKWEQRAPRLVRSTVRDLVVPELRSPP